ncbi:MAG: hypothetical protein HN361_07635 [Actinobacteria bacterium]|jgi:hypothetical protein|nr:hypothetical protein [Actinomycetota bacterium]MBT3563729.1 hypothetical protein [Gammaproteobacteria bacterium]MBT3747142.1 hypothetical protein [Actinomycetota bacterium]MBT3969274.1 hypothetical protein [Actinomycetota bacterium]MBT4302990.1 hypothetical protein [Actinomycetota bacterium]
METAERAAFVKGYSRVLTNAWSDEDFMGRLMADPSATLSEYGLDAGSASVTIETNEADAGSLDAQIEVWENGMAAGAVTLYVPAAPKVETAELSEDQLDTVGAGDTVSSCCCCPSCSCT